MLFCMLATLAACEQTETPAPGQDGPILSGVGDMPKALATVALSQTPDATSVLQTPVSQTFFPTETLEPPEPTSTPTPYVGVYLGTQTNGTPAPNSIPPLSIPYSPGNLPVPTVPVFLGGGTLSPSPVAVGGVIPTPVTAPGATNCTVPVASNFTNPYTQNPGLAQQLGCPRDAGVATTLAYQPFERGVFFWRDTREIYALQSDGRFYRYPDTWQEGMPDSDPSLAPPEGLLQPIRGFGLVWRTNENLRATVGWALQAESGYSSFLQNFDRGVMLTAPTGQVYALVLLDSFNGSYLGPLSP